MTRTIPALMPHAASFTVIVSLLTNGVDTNNANWLWFLWTRFDEVEF